MWRGKNYQEPHRMTIHASTKWLQFRIQVKFATSVCLIDLSDALERH